MAVPCWPVTHASLLHTDLETFARSNHVRIEFARGIQYLFDIGIFVVWIMMVESNTLHFGFDSDLDGLLPTAVAPPDVIGQFFRRVLSIDDEEIGIFCQHQDIPVAPPNAVLSTDRKSTRLNSSHGYISYAVFCLKKKN